ncbi:MAG TPA: aminotransferase class V-fold PLP-dependent enzyme [Candidatus Hydrothermia bacterium]|nr:aminotransferase class V-fold PLP-dependent enzyme [Candidatus Hydrothermae bacterium]MDD3648537.1 aminotransferase class V-fold PLP-dependent enzyme [Candidatus Hydrothermia bacterium]MDD5572722.1 aminotransferase class V-fold PLP-dependent enzyme [Candidatus Hydrothermia bacterium]HOK22603.1 aminotransferase class V-fold PLP-dependent enzyme [Candidatus Hydrothermia bacterium]HOL23310.1 aminotransferase class V-fold PLP-dependent enzyme [Candidatus Hydrothermia bacterium]
MSKFEEYRKYFPITSKYVYLNHASTSPLNLYSLQKASDYLEVLKNEGDANWDYLQAISESLRSKIAQLIKVKSNEIAFVQNTSIGINLIIESIKWSPGDEILVLKNSFPALKYPLLYNRYGIKVIEVPLSGLKEAISSNTKLIALEWVNYFTGERIDLNEILTLKQKHSFYVLLDAIQGLGSAPLYPKHYAVDFLVCGASKWLMGPQGVGIMYIDENAYADLNIGFVGWLSCPWEGFTDFSNLPEPFPDARIFETGTKNYWGLSYLGGNLDILLDIGIENISLRVASLIDYLEEELPWVLQLTPKKQEQRAGILTFRLPNINSEKLYRTLEQEKIKTSLRNGYIRISPHFYNTFAELDTLIDVIKTSGRQYG